MVGRSSKFQWNLLISIATLIAYFSTYRNEYLGVDDNTYVTENQYVKQGLTSQSVLYAFTSLETSNYMPVTFLAYEAQVALFGVNSCAMHITNLVFHLANALLVFRFLRLTTHAFYRSALVALFFAIHPLHVESVAWISELKDQLSTFFLLLLLLRYLRYCQNPTWQQYLLTLVLFALGLLSKPMLVTTPVLLCIIDVWLLNRWRSSKANEQVSGESAPENQEAMNSLDVPLKSRLKSLNELVWEKLPFLALSFAIGIVTIVAQTVTGAASDSNVLPFQSRVANALNACGWYLTKTLYPTNLCNMYLHPLKSISPWVVVRGAVLLSVISIWVWKVRRDRPIIAFGWLWFLTTLLPVIGLLQVGVQAYADRYTYIPHIGLFTMIVWEAHRWLVQVPRPWLWSAGLTVLTSVPLMVLTSFQVGYWKDTEALVRREIAIDPENYIACRSLGNILLNKRDIDESFRLLDKSLKIKPDDPNTHRDLAFAWIVRGDESEAEAHLLRAIELDPLHYKTTHNLASLYRKQKRNDEAIALLMKFIEKDPLNPMPRLKLAEIYWDTSALEQASQMFDEALRLRPNDPLLRKQVEEPRRRLKGLLKGSSPKSFN